MRIEWKSLRWLPGHLNPPHRPVGEQTCVFRLWAGLFAITILTNVNVRVVWRSTERGGDFRQDVEGIGASIALAKRAQAGPAE